MDYFINLNLMKNPVNWAIVILMWMLATMLLHYVSLHWNGQNSSKSGSAQS